MTLYITRKTVTVDSPEEMTPSYQRLFPIFVVPVSLMTLENNLAFPSLKDLICTVQSQSMKKIYEYVYEKLRKAPTILSAVKTSYCY